MTRREQMKRAIAGALTEKGKPLQPAQPAGVASDATPPKPPKVERSAPARDKRARERGRLPHNSRYVTDYDAKKEEWRGVLVVPDALGEFFGGKEFKHTADGVFRLLEELDVMYWQWVASQGTGTQPPAGEKGGAQ